MNNIMEITIMTWEQISKAIMKVVNVEIMWNVHNLQRQIYLALSVKIL
jgi:hypothetical protein